MMDGHGIVESHGILGSNYFGIYHILFLILIVGLILLVYMACWKLWKSNLKCNKK
jgi:hypothetical protein